MLAPQGTCMIASPLRVHVSSAAFFLICLSLPLAFFLPLSALNLKQKDIYNFSYWIFFVSSSFTAYCWKYEWVSIIFVHIRQIIG